MSRRPSRVSSKGTAKETPNAKPITVQFQTHMKSDLTLKTYPFESPGNVNRVYLVGDHPVLGEWIPGRAIPMTRIGKGCGSREILGVGNLEDTANQTLPF